MKHGGIGCEVRADSFWVRLQKLHSYDLRLWDLFLEAFGMFCAAANGPCIVKWHVLFAGSCSICDHSSWMGQLE